MITSIHSHRNGNLIIKLDLVDELRNTIMDYKKKLGYYKISDFRKYLLPAIKRKGWSDEYCIDRKSKITLTSIKDKTGLCIQTGNMARTYADLMKLQALYSRGIITGGILVIPTLACGKTFGRNVASFERVVRELDVFDQVITLPMIIISFDNED